MRMIDVRHLGREHVIAAWEVGDVIVDPGPASCLDTLLAGLRQRPRALALTHIHLDHAGAAGALCARWPDLEVWVHERGAPHLADPSRLLASAARLYGDDMERLWGEVLPVPEANLRVLRGGERIGGFEVAYTPGHASHHVAYLRDGTVFAGDVCGVRIAPEGVVLAPTPPPDIDLEAWRSSLALIRDWQPSRLALTHFGAWTDVSEHLDAMLDSLDSLAALAAELDCDAFRERVALLTGGAATYAQAVPADQAWLGLRRHLSSRI
jgi:glyoxylase-like metal-dependent hydrolase (beta-lactamase superfamily II)